MPRKNWLGFGVMQHFLTVSMVNVRGHQGRCRVWCWRQGKRGRGGLQVRDALLAAFERVESKIGQSLAEPLGNGQGPVFCQEMLHDPETPRLDELQVHAVLVCPTVEDFAGELGTLVRQDALGMP